MLRWTMLEIKFLIYNTPMTQASAQGVLVGETGLTSTNITDLEKPSLAGLFAVLIEPAT
jgi:hypothetical protein